MKDFVDVNTGEVVVCSGKFVLRALAMGSCIALTAYDATTQIAAMAHIMLPGRAPQRSRQKTRYAVNAIEQMLDRMCGQGANAGNIEACLIGAGNVLRKKDDTICEDNIEFVTGILAAKDIPVRASVVGGTKRKSAYLDTATGTVTYCRGNEVEKQLWRPSSKSAVKQYSGNG